MNVALKHASVDAGILSIFISKQSSPVELHHQHHPHSDEQVLPQSGAVCRAGRSLCKRLVCVIFGHHLRLILDWTTGVVLLEEDHTFDARDLEHRRRRHVERVHHVDRQSVQHSVLPHIHSAPDGIWQHWHLRVPFGPEGDSSGTYE